MYSVGFIALASQTVSQTASQTVVYYFCLFVSN